MAPILVVLAGVLAAARAEETPAEIEPVPTSAEVEAASIDTPVAEGEAVPSSNQLGEVGESCRARRDCRAGLHCIDEECHSSHEGESCTSSDECPDGLVCRESRCESRFAKHRPAAVTADELSAGDGDSFSEGFHLGAGINFGVGPVSWYGGGWDNIEVVAGLVTSVHILAAYNGLAGELEVAPALFLPTLRGDNLPFVTTGHLAVGYYLSVGERVHLVFRGGLGAAVGDVEALSPDKYLLFSMRIEPISLAYAWDRVILELTLPSIRVVTDMEDHTVAAWFVALRPTFLFL